MLYKNTPLSAALRPATLAMLFVLSLGFAASTLAAEKKTSFRIAWTIYAGWMPWGYASESGIIDKWAKKYGIKIEVVQMNDYIESINQYSVGDFDGCGMTNMDALTIPAASGVDTTGLILGDYSNGNDGIVLKNAKSIADIKGRDVHLIELSVSHYLLARALDMNGMSESDVTIVNTSDADAVASFSTEGVTAAAIWNPQLSIVKEQHPTAIEVFNSRQIPGEIIDMMTVKTDVLEANPEFGKALVGAWFETMALMSKNDKMGIAARTSMAKNSGTDLAGYESQLADTELFYTPASAYKFATDEQLKATMDKVRKFSFEKGLLGEGSSSPDAVGMEFPDGSTLGDKKNIQLRFDSSFVKMAVDGKL